MLKAASEGLHDRADHRDSELAGDFRFYRRYHRRDVSLIAEPFESFDLEEFQYKSGFFFRRTSRE